MTISPGPSGSLFSFSAYQNGSPSGCTFSQAATDSSGVFQLFLAFADMEKANAARAKKTNSFLMAGPSFGPYFSMDRDLPRPTFICLGLYHTPTIMSSVLWTSKLFVFL